MPREAPLLTGLRSSDAASIRWVDLDLDAEEKHVQFLHGFHMQVRQGLVEAYGNQEMARKLTRQLVRGLARIHRETEALDHAATTRLIHGDAQRLWDWLASNRDDREIQWWIKTELEERPGLLVRAIRWVRRRM